jgi:C-terminal peptidase prc
MYFAQKPLYKHIIFIFIWIFIGYMLSEYLPVRSLDKNTNIVQNLSNEDIFASEKVKKTMNLIRKNFYWFDKKTTLEIEDAILKSIVKWLWDKHSIYFTKKETVEFEESLRGDFEWIWAVINDHHKGIKIMKIIPNSPAEKSWLKAWDIMTSIWSINIVWKSTEDAVKVIRWAKWTIAEITYKRWDDNKELHVNVIRDKVNVPSVADKMLEKNIGYIEIATFWEHTTAEFVKSWNSLTASWAKWIILDFRNNPGGYLDTAVDIASIVLPKNSPVVTIKENNPLKNETRITLSWTKNNIKIPIIVLINDYSASASEIFAGALQDHGRALLLGEKSYGKGSVQVWFDIWDGSIVKITIARWFTPKGNSIDEKGISPDLEVLLTGKDYENVFDRQLKAAELVIQDQISMTGSLQDLKEKYLINSFTTLTK